MIQLEILRFYNIFDTHLRINNWVSLKKQHHLHFCDGCDFISEKVDRSKQNIRFSPRIRTLKCQEMCWCLHQI